MKIMPFNGDLTLTLFNEIINNVHKEIMALENDYIIKAPETELEQYYIKKAHIEPLNLDINKMYIENRYGTKIDVSKYPDRVSFSGKKVFVQGTILEIAIPYDGDRRLWQTRSTVYKMDLYPDITVENDRIIFKVSLANDSADTEETKNDIEYYKKALAEAIIRLNKDVEGYNKTVPNIVKEKLRHKKQQAKNIITAIEELNIPIKRRKEPLTYVTPTIRRTSPAKPPKVAAEKPKPQPILDEKEYNYILKVMRSMSLVIERNPHAFSGVNEEIIRTHFLLQLNGHYEGGATGETFNAVGKTDILIRVEDRNIFIAECKFWKGAKDFNKAIDQLLSYLAWQDTKCALIVFNKNRDSSSVLKKMHEVMESRSEYRCTVSHDPNGDSRYIFVKETDPGREINITTQLYDIPQS